MPLASLGFLLPNDVRSDFGFQTGIVPANPAAGQPFRRKVPGEFFEVVLSLRMLFTASAAVATRTMRFNVRDGDLNLVFSENTTLDTTANQSQAFRGNILLGSPFIAAATAVHMPLAPFVVPSGWIIELTADNIQAADTITQIGLVLQQFNTGIVPERFRGLTPVDVGQLGLLSSSALSTPTPAPAPIPGAAAPPPVSAPTFTAAPPVQPSAFPDAPPRTATPTPGGGATPV